MLYYLYMGPFLGQIAFLSRSCLSPFLTSFLALQIRQGLCSSLCLLSSQDSLTFNVSLSRCLSPMSFHWEGFPFIDTVTLFNTMRFLHSRIHVWLETNDKQSPILVLLRCKEPLTTPSVTSHAPTVLLFCRPTIYIYIYFWQRCESSTTRFI
ncbi:hypothetical protein BKA70DRAFT_1308610 [Coprinopsis sp. MPI-PUGE-AT-0042]|nr:hypothetical protein BKA70DRAFT_1308610 [Coprinopsis sp. MPI-PUGE-AT-0042]